MEELSVIERGARLIQAAPKMYADVGMDRPILQVDLTSSYTDGVGGMQERSELKVKLRRLRVVARAALLGRIGAWSAKLSQGMQRNTDEMADKLVGSGTDDGSSGGKQVGVGAGLLPPPPPRLALNIFLRGPLIVLPSPTLRCAAVLIRMGDFTLKGELALPEAPAFPALLELQARLKSLQVLVAPPQLHWRRGGWHISRLLTEEWQLVKNTRPHWILPQLGIAVNASVRDDVTAAAEPEPVIMSTRDAPAGGGLTPTIRGLDEVAEEDLHNVGGGGGAGGGGGGAWPGAPSSSSRERSCSSAQEYARAQRNRSRTPSTASSYGGAGDGRNKALHLKLTLSTVTASFAVREAVFLQSLIEEVVPLLAEAAQGTSTAGGSGAASAGAAGTSSSSPSNLMSANRSASPAFGGGAGRLGSTGAASPGSPSFGPEGRTSPSVDRPDSPRPVRAPGDLASEPSDGDVFASIAAADSAVGRLPSHRQSLSGSGVDHAPPALPAIKLDVNCDDGIWLLLIDDEDDALMPLYKVGVQHIKARLHGILGESDEVDPDATEAALTLTSGNASVAIMLEASHFNEHNGHWEPVVEPWHIAMWWIGVSEPASAVGASSGAGERERRNSEGERSGERGDDGEGEGVPREAAKGTRSAHTITLTADDVLNVNVTHAMLVSAIEVSGACTGTKERERERETGGGSADTAPLPAHWHTHPTTTTHTHTHTQPLPHRSPPLHLTPAPLCLVTLTRTDWAHRRGGEHQASPPAQEAAPCLAALQATCQAHLPAAATRLST